MLKFLLDLNRSMHSVLPGFLPAVVAVWPAKQATEEILQTEIWEGQLDVKAEGTKKMSWMRPLPSSSRFQ
jgi:hypothetical protein